MALIVEKHESVVSKNRIFEYIFARISHEPTLSQNLENDAAYNDFQRYFRRQNSRRKIIPQMKATNFQHMN